MADALRIHRVAAGAMAQRTLAVIREWLEAGVDPADVAVLARVNSALLPVQVTLGDAGVPRTAPLSASVLGRTGIRTALAYLRIGLDPERIRREDVFETINRPTRKVKTAITPWLKRAGRRLSMSQLEDIAGMLDGRRADRFEEYLTDLRILTAVITDGADTAEVLHAIRNRIGLGMAMEALDSSRTRPEGSSHGDDLDALEQLAAIHPDPVTFGRWLTDAVKTPGDDGGVQLSTIHRVKGMEWDRVVVFAANAGLLPHRLAEDVEEERRVFHVAITRCRDEVEVIAARGAPSPFLDELSRRAEPDEADAAGEGLPEPADPRRAADGGVAADPGLRVTLPGGLAGVVVAADEDGATVRLDRTDIEVDLAYGDTVRLDGEEVTLAPRPRTTRLRRRLPGDGDGGGSGEGEEPPPLTPAEQALFERLRSWRARTATDGGVPAYVVLHDAHLEAIARRRPADERELVDCPGIGPTRLERYGEDLLTIVADAAEEAEG